MHSTLWFVEESLEVAVNRTQITRRGVLQGGSLLALPGLASPGMAAQKGKTVRDNLWLWSHVSGSYNGMFGLPGKSRMTPIEASFYMGIPNVFMLHRDGTPEPPLAQFALPFEAVRDVVWGIVGDGGQTNEKEREMVLDLALHNPKISGVVMDDFFVGAKDGKVAALSLDQVKAIKQRLHPGAKKLDLWVVLYENQLEPKMTEYLALCEYVQFWTWFGQNLADLKKNFEKARQLSGGAKMALGIYWWDFGNKKPLTLDQMKDQCEVGLELLKQGHAESLIFCGSWLCDRGLETVDWTRQWIKQVGSQKVRG